MHTFAPDIFNLRLLDTTPNNLVYRNRTSSNIYVDFLISFSTAVIMYIKYQNKLSSIALSFSPDVR